MLERELDCDNCQVIEELISFLVGNVVIQLRIDDAPECALLRDRCVMLRVKEGDV